ncbi:MAG: translation elongation factor Ts [Gammaproteobacteria bacterium]
MSVSAASVKELRERTGAPLLDCKNALIETNNIEEAIEWLRKKGIAKAAKKEGRIAAEGCIVLQTAKDAKSGFMAEINCETDFVTRHEDLIAFANKVAQAGLTAGATDVVTVSALPYQDNQTIEDRRKELVAKIGENIQIRRVAYLHGEGMVAAYRHGERIGVLVHLSPANEILGKDLAMHIAASSPQTIAPQDVPAALVAKEREIFAEQAKTSGKPAAVIDKMIEGRVQKFINEVSLLGQPFIRDPDKTVGELVRDAKVKVHSFVRFAVGEGIEKAASDFAAEVMAQIRN